MVDLEAQTRLNQVGGNAGSLVKSFSRLSKCIAWQKKNMLTTIKNEMILQTKVKNGQTSKI